MTLHTGHHLLPAAVHSSRSHAANMFSVHQQQHTPSTLPCPQHPTLGLLVSSGM
jgi:hypothetical protein